MSENEYIVVAGPALWMVKGGYVEPEDAEIGPETFKPGKGMKKTFIGAGGRRVVSVGGGLS